MPRFSKNAVQRPREAYFINRHTTFCKEQNLNFSEHQNFLKSIKNSSQKMKKSEKIWKKKRNFSIFLKKNRHFWKFRKTLIFFKGIFEHFPKIFKISDFFQKYQNFPIFSDFLRWIFYGFQKKWCSEKLLFCSLQKVVCVFMKYASLGLCTAFFTICTFQKIKKKVVPSSELGL